MFRDQQGFKMKASIWVITGFLARVWWVQCIFVPIFTIPNDCQFSVSQCLQDPGSGISVLKSG